MVEAAPALDGAGQVGPPTSSSLPNSSRETTRAGSPVGASTSIDRSAYVRSVTKALRLGGRTSPSVGSKLAPVGPASASGAMSDASVTRSGPDSAEYAPRVSKRINVRADVVASGHRATPGSGDIPGACTFGGAASSERNAPNDPLHGCHRSHRSPVQRTGAPPAPPKRIGCVREPGIGVAASNDPSASMTQTFW